MKIILDEKCYRSNKNDIDACLRGEMCKILEFVHPETHAKTYTIRADVSNGWWFEDEYLFHGTGRADVWNMTGLGTFILISKEDTEDGGCILDFAGDLNPDMP